MNRCLIVGRTSDDQRECKAYGLNSHGPAPSTKYWNEYEYFDGDVITTHTVKYGARWACTVETSQRVVDSARLHPGRVVVGTSELHKVGPAAQSLYQNAQVLHHGPDMRYPDKNSGEFALWWAYRCGYKEIYTVGLDFVWDREHLARMT